MNLGVTELLIVLAIVLLLFGSTRLPALARSVGHAKRDFKRGEESVIVASEPVNVLVVPDVAEVPVAVVEIGRIGPSGIDRGESGVSVWTTASPEVWRIP